MTKRELAELILKLLGVYAIIQSLPFLQYFPVLLGGLGYETGRILSQLWVYITMSIPFALTAAAGIVLLSYSRGLACVLVKDDGDAKLTTSLRAEEIQAIGFSVVAVLVFLLSLSQLAKFIGYAWFIVSLRSSQAPMVGHVMSMWQNGLSFVVQCGLAIVLFFRAQGLANLWHRIQAGKYVKVEEAEQGGSDGVGKPPRASS
jgi:hypothetical protein